MNHTRDSEYEGRDLVQVRWMSAVANKLVHRLGPSAQRALVAKVLEPIPLGRCEPIKTLGRYQVRHFDVTRSARGTILLWDEGACLIHVGTHQRFERFIRRYRGVSPGRLIPLEESDVMNINPKNSKNPTTSKTSKSVAATPVVSIPEAQSLVEVFHALAVRAGEPDRAALLNMMSGIELQLAVIEAAQNDLSRSVADQSSRLSKQESEVQARCEALGTRLDQARAAFESKLADAWSRLRSDTAAEARSVFERGIAGPTCRIDRLEESQSQIDARLSTLAMGQRPLTEEIERISRGLDDAGRATDKLTAEMLGRASELQARLAKVAVGLSCLGQRVGGVEEQAEALRAKVDSQAVALRALAAANVMITSRFDRFEAEQKERTVRNWIGGQFHNLRGYWARLSRAFLS